MSVNYTGLKNTIKDILARTDIPDTAFDVFVSTVEQDIRTNLQTLELEDMYEADIEDGSVELPSDYQKSRVVMVNDVPLTQTDPQSFFENKYNNNFTTIGNKMYFGGGVQGNRVKILYVKFLDGLSATNGENAITKWYPNLYIFGLLREASYYINDKERASVYEQRFTDALDLAGIQEDHKRYSGSRLVATGASTIVEGM